MRVERRTPERAVGVAARHDQQALGLLGRQLGALVGDVGGGGGALEQRRAFAVVARPDLQHGLGEAQPVRAVVGRDHRDLAEDLQAAAEIVALEGRVRLAPQRGGGCASPAPASALICASSLIAASARSSRWNAFWATAMAGIAIDNGSRQ